ncbi:MULTISPECIES: hypothetical protein [unclassified Sutcliffiella]|uniref:hypothetical protein n=1 Tax=unclassified Sutcliffiella TaxID=2837532 RepID=UPI0030CB30C3
MKKSIEDSQVTILLEIDGEIHLVAMKKDNLDAIGLIVKASAETAYATGKTQKDLNIFLGYSKPVTA